MQKISICSELQKILTLPESTTLIDGKVVIYTHNITKIIEHVKECKTCQHFFNEYYKTLPIPPMFQLFIKQFLGEI